jgi:hypothetical protein
VRLRAVEGARQAAHRIEQARRAELRVDVELGAVEAERIEPDRAREREARLAAVSMLPTDFPAPRQRHDGDIVGDPVVKHADGDRAPPAQFLRCLELELPGLLGPQLVVARVDVVVLQIHVGEEVAEVELADPARNPQRDVEALRRLPRQRHRALGPHERARQRVRAGLRDLRVFTARADLQRQVRG